jgi:hypothetical protein
MVVFKCPQSPASYFHLLARPTSRRTEIFDSDDNDNDLLSVKQILAFLMLRAVDRLMSLVVEALLIAIYLTEKKDVYIHIRLTLLPEATPLSEANSFSWGQGTALLRAIFPLASRG